MAVELSPVGLGVSVGQLRTGESIGVQPHCVPHVSQDDEGNVNLTGNMADMARAGHEADIKRDVHWLWLVCKEIIFFLSCMYICM